MFTVREAVENDLEQMLDIYNDIILNTTAVWDYEPHTFERRKQWFFEKRTAHIPVYVAVDQNDQIVGFSTYGPFRTWAGYRFTVENSVYVHKEYRNRGIGKLLMPPIIESAKKAGLHAMVAGIDAENITSIEMHKKFGFEEVARFKQVGFKFNKWLDLVFMELLLS